jgi:cobalt-zinc-cadmium efflux system membrane fusion protein
MNRKVLILFLAVICIVLGLASAGCAGKAKADPSAEAPPAAKVERDSDPSIVAVDHPEQFALATADEHDAAPQLSVTGAIGPDVSRTVPVISLASGRVVEIDARLGDEVKKGQLLFKVRSTDIAGAFSDYRKATVNEQLARAQLDRAKTLYEKGAIAKKELEVAENAEDNAKVDVETTTEHLRILGSDLEHPTGIVNVYAPVSGVITDQQITLSAGVQALTAPNPLTIADLSHVWILCDVYENDLPFVHIGEYADVRLNAFPGKAFRGRVANIGPILDPSLRTAKVRLELENPGLMRIGMFVTATFHGQQVEKHAAVPASAVLHLHDRDWVYVPLDDKRFRRVEVSGGDILPGNMQEILSGIRPGDKVVANALVLDNTVNQ